MKLSLIVLLIGTLFNASIASARPTLSVKHTIKLGAVKIGSTVNYEIMYENTGTSPLYIDKIVMQSRGLTVDQTNAGYQQNPNARKSRNVVNVGKVILPGVVYFIDGTFQVRKKGFNYGILLITSNDSINPAKRIRIEAWGQP